MAKYQWDLYEIRNNMNLLQSLFNESNDENQRMLIQDTIDQYHEMLNKVQTKKVISNQKNDTSLDQYMRQYMEYLSENDQEFINIILDTFLFIRDFQTKDDIDYIVSFHNEELLQIHNDFLDHVLPSSIRTKE